MLQRFPIRVKLAIALAVPLLALLVVAVFEALNTNSAAGEIREQANLATAAIGIESLPSKLEDERNSAAIYLVGFDVIETLNFKDNATARSDTDEALEEFRTLLSGRGDSAEEAYAPALENMASELADLRQQVDEFEAGGGVRDTVNIDFTRQVFDGYTALLTPLFDTNRQVALEVDNPELRRGAQLIDLAARQTDLLARMVVSVFIAEVGGENPDQMVSSPPEVAELSALFAEYKDNEETINTKADDDYRRLQQDLAATPHLQQFEELMEGALSEGVAGIPLVIEAAEGPSEGENGYAVFRRRVGDELQSEVDNLTANAGRNVWAFWFLALVAVVVAGLATWWVSRSITRPLRSLTRQATDMANHRLPDAVLDILDTPLGDDVTVPQVEPITVQTRDEVADVADALNTVQDSALDLAVEQAVLRRNIADSFVNLGRRNQNLLGRQLDFITELEHNETDPDTLANLFRLDHLATRMRRNAESLLVLAGIDPPRKWAAPVRITDAIRAALGEVEDYQRVTVRQVEPATVMGSAAADLAHLLAELIENALIFSPPDQTVEIRGRSQPAGYTLAVIDSGLGMPPDELARANRRLAGAESFTIAPSKYLGHYVAGNLAARHNINVTLHNSPGHGITATINLPPTLLTSGDVAVPTSTDQTDAALGAPQLQTEFVPRAEDQPPVAPRTNGREKPMPIGAGTGAGPGTSPLPGVGGGLAAGLPGGAVDQTAGGLAKRSRADGPPAIPTQPNRRKPPAPDDALLQTLAAYTTGLHGTVDVPPADTGDDGGLPTEPIPSPAAFDDRERGRPSSPFDAPPVGPPTEPLLAPSAFDRAAPGRSPFDAPPVGAPARRAPSTPPPPSPRRSDRDDLDDLDAGPPTQPVASPAAFDRPLDRLGDDAPSPLSALFDDVDDIGDEDDPFDLPAGPRRAAPGARALDGSLAPPRDRDRVADSGDWAPPAARRPAPSDGPVPALPAQPRRGGVDMPPPMPSRGAPSPGQLGDPLPPAPPPPLVRRPEPGPGPGPRPGANGPEAPPATATASGLQRRVRGAQMPMTEPVNLRRGRGDADRPRGRADRGGKRTPPDQRSAPTPEPNGDPRAADEVYGFLSSFSAGVQRGLDESKGDDGDERERRRRTH